LFLPFSVKWTVRHNLASIPVCYRPFPLFPNRRDGSTDSKQTSKGLFIFQLSFER
jgi:hypothetical protein